MKFTTIIDNETMEMEFSSSLNKVQIIPQEDIKNIDCVRLSDNSYSLIIGGRTYHLTITPKLDNYEVTVDHHTHMVQIKDKLEILLEKLGIQNGISTETGEIYALIPGLVSRIFVKSGDAVKIGGRLCILEAMKMENEITSPVDGIIKSIHIEPGSNVEKGALIMEIAD
tara:strand:- start:37 stop:543 length:507 start_codon:yes stop_codon:yes gene_type:complete